MARVKAVIIDNDQYKTADGKYNVKYRITHMGRVGYVSSSIYIPKDQFSGGLVINNPLDKKYNVEIYRRLAEIEEFLIRDSVVSKMTMKELLFHLRHHEGEKVNFLAYLDRHVSKLSTEGRSNTASTFEFAKKAIIAFSKGSIYFSDITYTWLTDFDNWMIRDGKSTNTRSIYLRNIRKLFNDAIKEELISLEQYPFKRFSIRSEKTLKKNVKPDGIRLLKDIVLPEGKEWARDLWMLSFYLIGINMKDLLHLTEIINGRISYRRFKVSEPIMVEVLPEALVLFEKYRGREHLLYFIETVKSYKFVTDGMNKRLKSIGKEIGIPKLSSNYARHSWATIAARIGISKDDISAAMGHSFGSKTTGIYTEIAQERIDNANRMVCEYVRTGIIS